MSRQLCNVLFLSAVLSLAQLSIAASSCYLKSGSIMVSSKFIRFTATGSQCRAACAVERINWYNMVSAINGDFTNRVIATDSSCPRRGNRSPQMGYDAARRLLGVHIPGAPTFTYQTFVSSYLPDICRRACDRGDTSLTIPQINWEWGKAGFRRPLYVICRQGYNAATNRCDDIRGMHIAEGSESFLNSICNAA